MKQGFFPDMVYDQLYMEYKLPEGTNSTRVKADLEEIRHYLKSRPEIRSVAASIGGTPARYNLVRSIATPSLSYGELIIDFESPEALERNIDDIQQTLSDRYPDAYVKLKRYNLMFKKYPIEVQFTGPDPAVLHRLADSARCIMERTPEVCLITTDWEPRIPVLNIDYDQSAARRMGLSRQDIAVSMLSAAGGIPVGAFYEGTHKNTIYLKCTEADGKPVDNLENVPVFPMMPNLAGLFDGAAPQTQIGSDRPQRVAGIRPAYRAAETGEPRRTGRVGGSRRSALQRSARPAGNVLACARHRDRGGAAGRRRTNRGDSASVRIRTVVGG